MKGFKSADSRLVHLFQASREQWKQRAADKQQKLRALEIKVRDLIASREQWKARAMVAIEQQRQLELELETLKKKRVPKVKGVKESVGPVARAGKAGHSRVKSLGTSLSSVRNPNSDSTDNSGIK